MAPWFPCDWWDPSSYKWTYAEIYPLVGIGAMLDATVGKRLALPSETPPAGSDSDWYAKGLEAVNDRLWDSRPGYRGFYESTKLDWSAPAGKGFTGTVDGVTTDAAPTTHLPWAPQARAQFYDLADAAYRHIIAALDDPQLKIGNPESFDSDWNLDPSNTSGSIPHLLKTSWTQARAFMTFGDPRFRDGSTKMMRAVLDRGAYDFVNGGPYQSYDWSTGVVTHGKDYVGNEQAILAGLANHHIAKSASDRNDGLRIADQTLEFYLKYFVDWQFGGHIYQTDDVGNVTKPLKGDIFEQGYHSTELFYYLNIYASVFYKKQPFSVYYRFAPSANIQMVTLEPAELEPGALQIVNVTQDGHPFRGAVVGTTLILPPHEGGKLRVTFAPVRQRP